MSQTNQFTVSDPYLSSPTGGMWIPENDLTVDPEWGNIKMVTPIGRFSNINIIKPQQFKNPDGSLGAPMFSGQLLLNPNACGDLYRAIVAVATKRFPPETKPDPANQGVLRPFSAEELLFLPELHGGLHYPLRQGSDSYMRDPVKFEAWRDLAFINASMHANDSRGNPQRPVYYDDRGQMCDPSIFYRGCYGMMQITIYSYPKPGGQARSRGVGVGLNAVRFANHGQKLATFDAAKAASEAFAKVGNIPRVAQTAPEVGYGPNNATPGSVPPGVAMPGFAAPPQQVQPPQPVPQPQYQPQQAPQTGYPPQPPQSGYMPAGFRPPG